MMNKRSHTATTSSHWQELFQTLQHERVTQAEANLESFCQESQKRENALKAYISHLEQEVREAKKRKLCDEQDLENKLLANQQQQQQEKQILETKLVTSPLFGPPFATSAMISSITESSLF